ncbi:MAG TPA: ABC transporter substrate-binding protein [Candidatus Binatia bacterium]|jgi:putative ABC transport system substrate-binding protein
MDFAIYSGATIMRACLLAVSIVFMLAPATSPAGEAPSLRRVGLVSSSGDPRSPGPLIDAFRRRLRELGYVEGQNLSLELRFAQGRLERIPAFVEEFAKRKVDALVVSSVPAIRAAKRTTSDIPVVMLITVDPVATGIVKSLSRPGGNITGITALARDLRREVVDLFKTAAPRISRVGVLWNVEGRASAAPMKDYEGLGFGRKLQFQSLEVRSEAPDLQGAFQAAAKADADALIAVGNTALARHLKEIAELALKNRLPSLSERGGYAELGGLMDYSADYTENFRRLAEYVDKILKGEKAGDLPIEKSKFNLAVNLKTAQQLDLNIPQTVVKRADKVIR